MSFRGSLRKKLVGSFLAAALSTGVSCYRAEVDLTPLLDDPSPAGGAELTAGAAGEANESAANGGAGEPACEMLPEDPVQYQCRLRAPPKAVCDTQDSPGWAGCYNGGCSICQEVLRFFPGYSARHPCCTVNTTCGKHAPLKCSPLCPPPTVLDMVEPCFNLER